MLSDLNTYPRITVTPFQFRLGLIQTGMFDQMISVFNGSADRPGVAYFEYALSLDSDNPYFTVENTQMSEPLMYSVFQAAATL